MTMPLNKAIECRDSFDQGLRYAQNFIRLVCSNGVAVPNGTTTHTPTTPHAGSCAVQVQFTDTTVVITLTPG